MIVFAALSGFLAVALGAFGAHALKQVLSPEMLTVYQTAVEYHLIHSVLLFVVSALMLTHGHLRWLKRSALALAIGILLFSGSLYLLTLSGIKTLGIVTPFGGVSLLLGWLMLAAAGREFSRIQPVEGSK
ncbi:DUF423 domain-containing protein [Litoribrevibacter albus]|uniref:DUF423 domain-containing protein n=1 Tax=Litoribrevibacter albus TaxID=1473156 RepID=A0AA37S8X1_9GAMM|nr:DUF423 domain-containing protein [Litoribrevibacter albus]GLQ30549.1 DUF423 domain-containing protein [Litoribrevibacter albus]